MTFSFLNFMQSPVPGSNDDQSMRGEVAMDEGKEPKARDVLISQSSKVSTCPAMKIKPIADHQMTSPPLLSHCRYHSVLFDYHPNKIVNLPFPWAFFLYLALKQVCPSCYVYEIILYMMYFSFI